MGWWLSERELSHAYAYIDGDSDGIADADANGNADSEHMDRGSRGCQPVQQHNSQCKHQPGKRS